MLLRALQHASRAWWYRIRLVKACIHIHRRARYSVRILDVLLHISPTYVVSGVFEFDNVARKGRANRSVQRMKHSLKHTFLERQGSHENALFFLALTSEVVVTGAMPRVKFLSVVSCQFIRKLCER